MFSSSQFFFARHNPFESMSNKPLHILLGYSYFDRTKKIYFTSKKNYGSIPVFAKSRHGKSASMKDFGYKCYKEGRKVIVFEPFDEWETIGNFNQDAMYPDLVDKLFVVQNFAFRISEADDPRYWLLLDFTDKAIRYIMMLLENPSLFNDSPRKFFRILESLPTRPYDVEQWNEEFGHIESMRLKAPVHEATYRSLVENGKFAQNFFYNPDNDDRQNIDDWDDILEHNNFIIFNFGLNGQDKSVRNLLDLKCSMTLDKIGYQNISQYHPVIFVEESDYFIPSESSTEFSLSREKFDEINRKQLRNGMFIFYLNQIQETCGRTVFRDRHQLIVGNVGASDSSLKEVHEKYHRFLYQKRVFVYKNEDNQEFLYYTVDTKVMC